MRRLLGGVNGTFLYTICGGLLQLVSQLNSSRSELYLNTLIHVVETFAIQSGGHFDHILPYLHDQEETEKLNLSYFLNNNGMTNMMYPILQILISSPKYLKATKSPPRLLLEGFLLINSLLNYECFCVIFRQKQSISFCL